MDWKRDSIEELREYGAKRTALASIPAEISQIKSEMSRLCGGSNAVPVKGGGSVWEDRQINLIVKKDKLETSLAYVRTWVKKVESGLAILTQEERLILDRFYINPEKGNVDRLCGDLHLEKSAVYARKEAALRRYTLARYGCVEI